MRKLGLLLLLASVLSWAQVTAVPVASSGAAGSIPVGSILLTLGAACPAGFTESTALAGKTLFGTLAANGDVGTTGGSDTITPAGNNSAPALTMSAYTPAGTNSAPALTMNSYTPAGTNSTSTVTPLGSVAAPVISWPAGVPAFAGSSSTVVVNHVHVETINSATTGATGSGFPALLDTSTSGGPTSLWMSTANPTGGASSYTPAGTNTWPVGVPTNAVPAFTGSSSTVAAQAFTGTAATLVGSVANPAFTGTQVTLTGSVVAPTFTGVQFDNRSAYVKVIFCVKD